MAKTKENDWSVFLTNLGYDANNPGEKAVIDALKGKKTTPSKLASLWTEDVPLKECEDWLKGEGINSGDARTHIISGIKDLAPKDKTAKDEKGKGKDSDNTNPDILARLARLERWHSLASFNFWAMPTSNSSNSSLPDYSNQQFRAALMLHQHIDPDKPFCMLTGSPAQRRLGKAAHIIPRRALKEENKFLLDKFAFTKGLVDSEFNGIFMLAALEAAFDGLQLCITYNPFQQCLCTCVLDPDLTGQIPDSNMTYKELHGKPLITKGRISMRALSLHAFFAFQRAKDLRHITEDEWKKYRDFSQLSPEGSTFDILTDDFVTLPSELTVPMQQVPLQQPLQNPVPVQQPPLQQVQPLVQPPVQPPLQQAQLSVQPPAQQQPAQPQPVQPQPAQPQPAQPQPVQLQPAQPQPAQPQPAQPQPAQPQPAQPQPAQPQQPTKKKKSKKKYTPGSIRNF